jgi:hypothetical protein
MEKFSPIVTVGLLTRDKEPVSRTAFLAAELNVVPLKKQITIISRRRTIEPNKSVKPG